MDFWLYPVLIYIRAPTLSFFVTAARIQEKEKDRDGCGIATIHAAVTQRVSIYFLRWVKDSQADIVRAYVSKYK